MYKLLDTAIVNNLINASKFYLTNETLDALSTGKNIPRVSGVTYEVIVGTTGYNFTAEHFKDPERTGSYLPNDGIVTTKSAQTVGGQPIIDRCLNYYEVGLTHTELNDHQIINRIIARSVNEQVAEESGIVAGYNQYYTLSIKECSPDDKYVLIGKSITKAEVFQPLQCGCGNGACGVDENAASCPSDCAGFTENNLFGGAIGIGVVGGGAIVLIFILVAVPLLYYLGRRSLKKRE